MYYDEEWRPVVGYEGWYEVSDYGRVRSLDRDIRYSNGDVYHRRGKILSDSNGSVMLGRNGTRNYCNPYELSEEAFGQVKFAKRPTTLADFAKDPSDFREPLASSDPERLLGLSQGERTLAASLLRSLANFLEKA